MVIRSLCTNKARRVLGIIYRNTSPKTNNFLTVLKLYMALVRPHLEYATSLESISSKGYQQLGESTKVRFENMLKKFPRNISKYLLSKFQVPTLQNRRLFLCLCTIYSIVNELVFFPEAVLPSTMPVTSSSVDVETIIPVPI